MLNIEKYKDNIINNLRANITCCVNDLIQPGKCRDNCKECKKHAMEWLLEEYKETILDEVEKAYLSAVIKPFRNRIRFIVKIRYKLFEQEFIYISVEDDSITFPTFKLGTKYKGMEVGKPYSLEELGL